MSTVTCPCCGQPTPATPDVVSRYLAETPARVYDIIRKAGWDGITTEALMARVYGHREDGGPLSRNIITVFIYQINEILRPNGQEIVNIQRRYRLRGKLRDKRKLRKLDEDKIRAIRRDTRSPYEIARSYDVTRQNIVKIKKNQIWRHVV